MKKTLFSDGLAFISRSTRGLAAAALAATALLSALPLTTRAADEPAADRKAIAADLNRHGFDLFRLVSEKDTKENAFVSPYSINSAFGLVYCGAKGKTAQEIRDTLGLPADPEKCGEFFHAVSQEYAANKVVEVLVSNSVWYEKKYDDLILPSFTGMIEKYYGGTFYKEDFSQPGPLVSKVNAYVEERTKNMIKDLLSPSDITPKTFMILLNTLFFEAKWKTPFKKDDTKPMIFRNFDNKEKRVRMMYRRGRDIGYYSSEEDNVHAVVLPYEDTRFDLIALMPIQPGSDRGEAAMNNIISKIGDKLDAWLENRSPYETRLWLPIVDLTCKYSLKDALGELGMTTPFDEMKANFRGIAEPSPDPEQRLKYIWIEKVIHKTALKMDEEKTQAAAATAIIMGGFGGGVNMQPPPVNIFRADRPFLVLIRDSRTGLILFAGRINDPGVEATEADGPVMPSFNGMPFPNGFDSSPFQQRSNGGFGPPVEGPARTTVPGATVPGAKPAAQTTIPRQTTPATVTRPASTLGGEPASAKVDGQISVILEGTIDGKDAFVFLDGKIFLQHLSHKEPAGLTVNGKPWTDLTKSFDLGFTPDLATTRFTCEGRGQVSLTRGENNITVTVYDHQGAATRYRIVLFQPSGVKEPLEMPKDPVDKTVVEIPVVPKPATAAQTTKARTGESAATNVDGDRNDQDVFTMFETDSGKLTGAPLWNTERYGVPEIRLRELVDDAAKRAEADLRSLSPVRTISIDAEHSTAEIDFTLVDEYSKIVRFIDEIEKATPRLAWSRLEIRIEPARALAGQQAGAAPTTTARQVRMTAQIRVIKYTPAKNKSVPAVGAAAPAEIKQKPGSSTGDPDFLAKLYDLSLSIPDDALVTQLRFTDMNCTLTIQASNTSPAPDRYLISPYWKIGSLTQRILSNEVCSFSVGLVRVATSSPPHPGSVTAENKVAAIVARNIFDPERTNKKADRGKPSATSAPAAEQTATSVESGAMVLEGTFDGSGAVIFMGSMIAYSHKDGAYPTGVKIDGKPWTDLTKPLMLDSAAIPARIIRKQARGTVTLLPADDNARLEIDDHQDASASYRIEFGTKKAGGRASSAGQPAGQPAGQQAKPEQKSATSNEAQQAAPSAEPGVIVLEGKLSGEGKFFFRKDSISYQGSRGRPPTDVKVNGTPWTDLKQPIRLDAASGFVPVRIRNMEEMYITAALTPDGEKAELDLSSASSREGYYRIELAGPKTASASASGGVVIEGVFNGIGSFRFNGSRISYHHIAFMIPRNVTVNGRPWQLTSGRGVYWLSSGGGDANPDFDLGFIPDFQTSQIVGRPDLQNFSLTKDGDGMELHLSDLKQDPKKTQIRIEAENKDASSPSADRAEITIQATGGQGAFSFRKNRVVFIPTSRQSARTFPKNVTVNDTSWTDLSTPFKLDFLPGFGTAKVLEATGSGFVRTEKKPDNVDLVFDNSNVFRGTPTRFTVDVEKRSLPAPDNRFTVEIRANLDNAAAGFRFQGRTVTYWPLSDKTAKNVTVNGKPWTDLDKPFELDFEVDPLRAQVMDRIGACTFEQLKHPDSYMLRVDNKGPAACGFVAELNGDAPGAAAVSDASQETVTIGMELRGSGRLTFRDNRIYFKLFGGGYPGELTVNGKPWDDPDQPFELDFVPEFSTAKIASMKTLGGAAELTAENDRAELFLNTSGSLRSYQIDLAMKKRKDAVPGTAPSTATEQTTATASPGTGYMGFAGIGPFSPGAAANMTDPNETVVFEVTTSKGCTFTFQEDQILCETPERPRNIPPGESYPMVTINGRLLNELDKPILLNFIPDFDHADVTVSFERRSRITGMADSPVQIRRGNGKMTVTTLEINNTTSRESASYSVRIAMKKLADSKRDTGSGARLTLDDPKRLANAGQIQNWSAMMQGIVNAMEGVPLRSLDFDAEIAGTGVFEFFGDRIAYRHESGERPSGVTVGGKAWENLDEPFEMPFVADNFHETLSYRYAVDSPVSAYPYKPVSLVNDRGRVYLAARAIAEADGGTPCRYHVHYVMSELNLLKARKERPPKAVTGQVTVSGVRVPARDVEAAPDMATVVIEGVLDGRGSFVVEGNAIRHTNTTGKTPTRVTVNGKPWTDLTEPLMLDFTPEYPPSAKMVETRGRITPMLASLSQKVEVTYNDSGDFCDFYRIVFTMKKKPDGK